MPLLLSIASPDSSLYQAVKAGFREYIMKMSNYVFRCFPQNAKWIYNGAAAMRVLMPRETYLNKRIELLRYFTPPNNANATSVDIVMDIYTKKGVKEGT